MSLKTILITYLLCLPIPLLANDYTLIQKLPEQMAALKVAGHKKWDTGQTALMVEGSIEFNKGLVAILKELARTYCPKNHLTEQEVDEYHEILVAKNIFEQKTRNPSAEDRGTIEKLEVPSSVSDDLCKEIVEMVKAISENEVSFDFKAWNRKWETASKVGD